MDGVSHFAHPLPILPRKGEVDMLHLVAPARTLPLAGRDGEGGGPIQRSYP